MPLETATSIPTLDPTFPLGSDPVASGDDHIRLIKTVLKTTFPNLTTPVTASASDLNTRGVPTGFIGMWSGASAAIPAGWFLCDGLNATPDLRDRFIVGAGNTYAVGGKGGAVNATTTAAGGHAHTTDTQGSHTHTGTVQGHQLTIEELPAHHHQGWGESMDGAPFGTSAEKGHRGSGQTDNDNYYYNTSDTGGNQAHTHGLALDAGGGHSHTTATAGDHTHTVDTRSPFYALCFIMKG